MNDFSEDSEFEWVVVNRGASISFVPIRDFVIHCDAIGAVPEHMPVECFVTLKEAKHTCAERIRKWIDPVEEELAVLKAKLACCS